MTRLYRNNQPASPSVLTSIEVPNERLDLIRVSMIGNINTLDTGVWLLFDDGAPLSWIECEDVDKQKRLVTEFKKLVLARDACEYYKPDFSFMFAKQLTDESEWKDDMADALEVDEPVKDV